jgi:hypothetical protein
MTEPADIGDATIAALIAVWWGVLPDDPDPAPRLDWETFERFVAWRHGRLYLGPNVGEPDRDDTATTSWLAVVTGLARRTISANRRAGTIGLLVAERLCDRIGVHPAEVWGIGYHATLPADDTAVEARPARLRRRLERDAEYLASTRSARAS